MSTYKLTYFNARARGETSRMMFKIAGQEFEDCRIDKEEWPKLKPMGSPFGQLPVLEVDGIKLCQAKAIERLLAKRFGLYGQTDMEQAKSDMVLDCLEDMRNPFVVMKNASEQEKPELRKKFEEDKAPQFLGNLEKMVNDQGFASGNKITWPDIYFYNVVDFGKAAAGVNLDPIIKKYPNITRLLSNVETNPKIAAWIKERPHSKF